MSAFPTGCARAPHRIGNADPPLPRRQSHGTRAVAKVMRWVFATMALALAMVVSLFAAHAGNADDRG